MTCADYFLGLSVVCSLVLVARRVTRKMPSTPTRPCRCELRTESDRVDETEHPDPDTIDDLENTWEPPC